MDIDVKALQASHQELYAALRMYESCSDDKPPTKHREMMERAAALIEKENGN